MSKKTKGQLVRVTLSVDIWVHTNDEMKACRAAENYVKDKVKPALMVDDQELRVENSELM